MTDAELLAAIEASEVQAIGEYHGEIASDRADAIARYLGKAYGDEVQGRSSIVSRDVSDVVEGVLANVLKPFVGGDRVVQFDPRGPEDVEMAAQETDYVNFVALERNNGFLVLNSAVKDALLLRAGYVLCEWCKREDVVLETYYGQSDDQLAMLMNDPEVEVVAHSEYPDPDFVMPQMQAPSMPAAQAMSMGNGPNSPPPAPVQQPMVHDVKVRRKRPTEYVETLPTPPDEILVSTRVRGPSLQDADFVQHRVMLMLSQIREMGYDVPDDLPSDDDEETIEDIARQRFGQRTDLYNDDTSDPARRMVMFKRSWMRIDRDGDGIAELRKICQVGKTLLDDEEVEFVPIACFSAMVMPHQHLGLSVYDLIADLARIKTALMRQFMDNKYLANNSRMAVDVDKVNLDDLLVSRPGGVVRVQGPPGESLFPIVTPDTGPSALAGLEYLDSVRENRTGYTRYAQGMDSDSLINKTATGLTQAMSQSQMRLEMMARTIAETGMRDMFRLIHAMTLKYSSKAEKIRIRNEWVMVNPREWVRRTDLSISVGLGSASQQSMVQNLMMIGQAQQQGMALGLATPTNVYNLFKKLANAAGFKSADEFFTAPQPGQPPPQHTPPEVMAEQVKGQANMQIAQVKAQSDAQIAQVKAAAEGQVHQARMQADMAVQQHKIQTDAQLKVLEARMQMQLDAVKHDMAMAAQIEIAKIKAAAQVQSADITASKQQADSMYQQEMSQ
jgi:hypothetical protein